MSYHCRTLGDRVGSVPPGEARDAAGYWWNSSGYRSTTRVVTYRGRLRSALRSVGGRPAHIEAEGDDFFGRARSTLVYVSGYPGAATDNRPRPGQGFHVMDSRMGATWSPNEAL